MGGATACLINLRIIPAWEKLQGLCRTGLEFERNLANRRNGLRNDTVLLSKVNAMHVDQRSSMRWGLTSKVKAWGVIVSNQIFMLEVTITLSC